MQAAVQVPHLSVLFAMSRCVIFGVLGAVQRQADNINTKSKPGALVSDLGTKWLSNFYTLCGPSKQTIFHVRFVHSNR